MLMVPVEELEKFTVKGAVPDVGLPLNAATGAAATAVVVAVAVLEYALKFPAASVACTR